MKISIQDLEQLALEILDHHQFPQAHREAIVKTLMTAQKDQCHSHGVWRLIEIINNVKYDRLDPQSEPIITQHTGAIIKVDAKMSAAPYAQQIGFPLLVDQAKHLGIAFLAINRCIHFSALWVEIEELTRQGLVAINMTTSHAWVAPFGGTKPLLGTNPIAFGWPRLNQEFPYVFDFATSETARGEIQLHQREHKDIPPNWAIDNEGNPTINADEALKGAMLPFGSYKGASISTMIELLAGPLIGDLTSKESMEFAGDTPTLPYGGEVIIAIDPYQILGDEYEIHFERAETLFSSFLQLGARLPSQRRFAARKETEENQYLTIAPSLYQDLLQLKQSNQHQLDNSDDNYTI